jgi:hypothetical protein
MNTSFLNVSFNGTETTTLPTYCVEVKETIVLVNTLIQSPPKTLFLKIKHNQLNTLLDLTNCAPYELWYFDEKEKFTGKSFSLQNGNAPFQIQTQARYIALVPSKVTPVQVTATNQNVGTGSFTLSKSFLPDTAPYSKEIAAWTLSLFELSNEELVDKYIKEIPKKGWTQARSYYLDCLQKEFRNRPFNSDIIFDFDKEEKAAVFKIGRKIELNKDNLDIIY